jgi:hypothetical protein
MSRDRQQASEGVFTGGVDTLLGGGTTAEGLGCPASTEAHENERQSISYHLPPSSPRTIRNRGAYIMDDPQKYLQQLSDDYQTLQTGKPPTGQSHGDAHCADHAYHSELETTVEARQKLESQLQENKGVQKVRSSVLGGKGKEKKTIFFQSRMIIAVAYLASTSNGIPGILLARG